MPSAPLRFCAQPGCPAKVTTGRCQAHQRTGAGGWHAQGAAAPKRIAGRRLQRLREQLFAREPFCRACKVALAEIRDHIVPLTEGGADVEENTQPLCVSCSDRKTQAESLRGRRRVASR